MTWLQIAYVTLLYFGLAEAVFRHLGDVGETFGEAAYRVCKEEDDLIFIAFFILCYVFWPVTFTIASFFERRERIAAVTRKLTS